MQCTLLSPIGVKSLPTFNTKVQDFKRVLDLNCMVNNTRIEQFSFFNWLSNAKNLVFSNGSKHVRIVALKYLTKIAERHGALPPDPHSLRRRGVNPGGDASP